MTLLEVANVCLWQRLHNGLLIIAGRLTTRSHSDMFGGVIPELVTTSTVESWRLVGLDGCSNQSITLTRAGYYNLIPTDVVLVGVDGAMTRWRVPAGCSTESPRSPLLKKVPDRERAARCGSRLQLSGPAIALSCWGPAQSESCAAFQNYVS
jgi:hypothetical protein